MSWKRVGAFLTVAVLSSVAVTAVAQSPVSKAAVPVRREKLTPADVEAKLARLTELCQKNERKKVAEEFGDEDIVGWLNAFDDKAAGRSKVVDALHKRGTCFSFVGNHARARHDFEHGIELSPSSGHMWNSLGRVYERLGEKDKALDAFNKAFEFACAAHKTKPLGWMPISATLSAASILMQQSKYTEALEVLNHYNDEEIDKMGTYWACRMLRGYGQVYLGMGREAEAMAKFKAALELETKQEE